MGRGRGPRRDERAEKLVPSRISLFKPTFLDPPLQPLRFIAWVEVDAVETLERYFYRHDCGFDAAFGRRR